MAAIGWLENRQIPDPRRRIQGLSLMEFPIKNFPVKPPIDFQMFPIKSSIYFVFIVEFPMEIHGNPILKPSFSTIEHLH